MKQLLVLTPDGVGSTFLQRSLCIFGNLSGQQYYNIHEITNGIGYDNNLLTKDWSLKYSQDLDQIQGILEKNNQNLICRLAHYHIINRNDSPERLENFYNFLNNNYDIIYCVRKNIFEYAHSWTIRHYKNILNVYTFAEKNAVHPVTDSFTLNKDFFANKINDYFDYLYWVNDNFNTAYEFDYDNLEDVDSFICKVLNLESNPFYENFGISLYEYCHLSNMDDIKHLPKKICKAFFEIRKYSAALVYKKIMPNSLPLKMNSMEKKIKKTVNFNELVSIYNIQTKKYNRLPPLTASELEKISVTEQFGRANQNIIIENLISRLS